MRGLDHGELRVLALALVLMIGVGALGASVATRPPTALDVAAFGLRGRLVGLATFFTTLGRTPMLVAVTAAAIVGALALRQSAVPVAYLGIVQVLGQGVNALVKRGFRRMRPKYRLDVRDRDFSYPSGHAMTTVVFFVGLLLLVVHAPISRVIETPIVAVLGVCFVGIPWSRLALGVHYATDVLAGLAFGTAWLLTSHVVAVRIAAAGIG